MALPVLLSWLLSCQQGLLWQKVPVLLTAESIKAKERSMGDYSRDYRL